MQPQRADCTFSGGPHAPKAHSQALSKAPCTDPATARQREVCTSHATGPRVSTDAAQAKSYTESAPVQRTTKPLSNASSRQSDIRLSTAFWYVQPEYGTSGICHCVACHADKLHTWSDRTQSSRAGSRYAVHYQLPKTLLERQQNRCTDALNYEMRGTKAICVLRSRSAPCLPVRLQVNRHIPA